MIPLKLQLKNFLSYGPQTQTIDFGPYHLICLSGKNGHGKSALLDALTWAVWGQARKILGTTKADEGLLRLGQTTMVVLLEFASHGHLYRVRREFSFINGKSHTQLDFGVIDPVTSACKPYTDKTIKGTQENIIKTIGLDYEGFINSVFLRQGQANEFSKKSPKDRKEILATILGLHHYEQLRKRAFEKLRAVQSDKDVRVTLKEHIKTALLQEPLITQALSETLTALANVEEQETALGQKLNTISCEQKIIAHKTSTLARLSATREHILSTLTRDKERLGQLVTTWRKVNRNTSDTPNTRHHELALIEQQLSHIQEQASRTIALQQLYLATKEKERHYEEQLRRTHEHKINNLEKRIAMQEQAVQTLSAQLEEKAIVYDKLLQQHAQQITDLHTLQHTIRNSPYQESAYISFEQQFERRRHYYQKFITHKNLLAKELKQYTEHAITLAATEHPACPFCEQSLTKKACNLLAQKFDHDKNITSHQLQRLEFIIDKLKELLKSQHAMLQSLKHAREEQQHNQHHEQELSTAIKTTEIALKEQKHALQKHAHVVENENQLLLKYRNESLQISQAYPSLLAHDTVYQSLIQKTRALEEEQNNLAYDQSTYDSLIKRQLELRKYQSDLNDMIKDRTRQDQRKEEIHGLCTSLKLLKKELHAVEHALRDYTNLNDEQKALDQQYEQVQTILRELQKNKEQLLHKRGILEQQSDTLRQQQEEFHAQEKILTTLETTINDYQAIVHTLSKDGIQALLIEDAIPDIEHEANMLLAQLTDNQAHLSIESLRDLKSGGTRETLDIKISDALGIRPYELFSGGEAFRIDFALRIALSKLLARRAGTSLQTLIIDEGFGSQDEEGLSHIMDALHKINENFAKIIIVSHLSSMKEQFPVHFIVNKGPYGSLVRVIEHG